jgi:hypothetical protein
MCLDQITDVPLVKPADTTYNYGLGVPRRTRNASNYYVDVLFTPTAPAPAPPPVIDLSFRAAQSVDPEYDAIGGNCYDH